MITHTSAIVLKSIDFQESSKILTVLSRHHGKISLIARGVKRPKNKLAGIIEIGNILDVVYYYKTTRSIQNLTEASINFSSLNYRSDFERASILFASLELVNQIIHENEVNENVFTFLMKFITWLSNYQSVNPSIFCYVQLRCAKLIGFNLTYDADDTLDERYFDLTHGLISSQFQSELSYKLTVLQSRFLQLALSSKNEKVFQTGLAGGELKQLIHHLDVYFKYHIEGYQDRKSDSIFDQMLKDYS